MKNGAELAVADINAAGGVLGKKLELAGRRRRLRSEAGARGRREVRRREGAVRRRAFLLGSSIPASEVYAEGGVLQISPASTNPLFTERKLWNTFRVCGRDDQQGLVAGNYLAKNFKGKNIAILHDKTTYGKGLADETKKALNKAGVHEKMFEVLHQGRQGLHRARLQAEGGQHRRRLSSAAITPRPA